MAQLLHLFGTFGLLVVMVTAMAIIARIAWRQWGCGTHHPAPSNLIQFPMAGGGPASKKRFFRADVSESPDHPDDAA